MEWQSIAEVGVFGGVQLLGWVGGLMARVGHRSARHTAYQAFFMLMLLVVGFGTPLAFFLGHKAWLISAFTLAGMILLAICDFDRSRRPATIG